VDDREKDLQAEDLADLARRLEAALDVETPDARSEKALFVAGAGTRARRSPWSAALVPATAAVAVLIVLGVVSRSALPGQTLYPVRKVLGGVGLAPSTAGEVRERIDRAERLVDDAAADVVSSPDRAMDLALRAISVLDEAERLADEVDGSRKDALDAEIDALEDRADAAYDEAEDNLEEREREVEDGDDPTGSGSGDDSSGSGSGDDSSGSGSGDDDSSGSGSGGDDSGDDDDSSGSGSGGDDGDDDDSSGSGSGGDDDSSGSGSGGDDDGDRDSSGKG
jgi:hypothetical protein